MVWDSEGMLGPAMAKGFIRMDRNKKPLDPSIDINRFYKKMHNMYYFYPRWVVRNDKHIDVNVSCPSRYIREQDN
jgi:hypothetical protein